MPTYQYACTECGHAFEQFQSFTDDALTECPQCQGRLRKLFNAVGVVFKGSGFYRNDSRAPATSNASGKDPARLLRRVPEGTAKGSGEAVRRQLPAPEKERRHGDSGSGGLVAEQAARRPPRAAPAADPGAAAACGGAAHGGADPPTVGPWLPLTDRRPPVLRTGCAPAARRAAPPPAARGAVRRRGRCGRGPRDHGATARPRRRCSRRPATCPPGRRWRPATWSRSSSPGAVPAGTVGDPVGRRWPLRCGVVSRSPTSGSSGEDLATAHPDLADAPGPAPRRRRRRAARAPATGSTWWPPTRRAAARRSWPRTPWCWPPRGPPTTPRPAPRRRPGVVVVLGVRAEPR